ncbi:MAG TPA: hypothetical protein ENK44_13745 [Caldithrix abyssi]|uniref:Choice-of-anchor D domain-containing protein n=1 Tax=Caldithrix abyssi TaxID=187145 RepID=A0A7V4WVV5_CALAY|nr:hypothetical protein [Caldithrix abyssi]
MERRIKTVLQVLLALFLVVPTYAQLRIIHCQPQTYSSVFLPGDSIKIEFNKEPATSFIFDNIVINGRYKGRYSFNYSIDGRFLYLYGLRGIIGGDLLRVELLSGLRAADGDALDSPYSFEFWVKYQFGNFFDEYAEMKLIPINADNPHNSFLTAIDLVGKGNADLILGNSEGNTITVFSNLLTPEGQSFNEGNTYGVGDRPVQAVSADFDADGAVDVAVVCNNSNELYIFWGNNTSALLEPTVIHTGYRPIAAAVLDVNNDGISDIAVALSGEDKVVVYSSTGNRTFTVSNEISTEQSPTDVAVADLTLDGLPDLLIAQGNPRSIALWRKEGSGFAKRSQVVLEKRPTRIIVENVNLASAQPEIIVSANDVSLLGKQGAVEKQHLYLIEYEMNTGALSLVQKIASGSSAYALQTTNLNASYNNTKEVLYAEYDGGRLSDRSTNGSTILENSQTIYGRENLRDFICLDFNGDGAADIAAAGHFAYNIDYIGTSFPRIGIPAYLDRIDFGDVFITQSKTVGFAVENKSSQDMNITATVVTQNAVYSATPVHFILSARDTQRIEITFAPLEPIRYNNGYLEISSDDSLFETKRIQLIGQGVRPELAITPSELDFGVVPQGEQKELSLLLTNPGNTILRISSITNMLRAIFNLNTRNLDIPASGSAQIYATFTPDQLNAAFIDTFYIQTNDPLYPVYKVPLLGKASNKPPSIIGPERIEVVEHSSFQAVYNAVDPDSEEVSVRIDENISWVTVEAGKREVSGTAPEGAQDAEFWVYANDGYLEDTMRVTIDVIPVNDPPRITGPGPISVFENEKIEFRIQTSDPENDPLKTTVRGLPAGASFDAATGTFLWQTGFDDAGLYNLLFITEETNRPLPLRDSLQLRLEVKDRLPDLYITQLETMEKSVTVFKETTLHMAFANTSAPLTGSFSVKVTNEGAAVWDTSITNMVLDQTIYKKIAVKIRKVSSNKIKMWVDYQNSIRETNENNNIQEIVVSATPGKLIVRPNPFTPNNDQKNDRAVFDMTKLVYTSPQLIIYDVQGRKIRTVADRSGQYMYWDGKDDNGNLTLPGLYLYILKDGQDEIARGMIVVAL